MIKMRSSEFAVGIRATVVELGLVRHWIVSCSGREVNRGWTAGTLEETSAGALLGVGREEEGARVARSRTCIVHCGKA